MFDGRSNLLGQSVIGRPLQKTFAICTFLNGGGPAQLPPLSYERYDSSWHVTMAVASQAVNKTALNLLTALASEESS
jgi:hypothetical protein